MFPSYFKIQLTFFSFPKFIWRFLVVRKSYEIHKRSLFIVEHRQSYIRYDILCLNRTLISTNTYTLTRSYSLPSPRLTLIKYLRILALILTYNVLCSRSLFCSNSNSFNSCIPLLNIVSLFRIWNAMKVKQALHVNTQLLKATFNIVLQLRCRQPQRLAASCLLFSFHFSPFVPSV